VGWFCPETLRGSSVLDVYVKTWCRVRRPLLGSPSQQENSSHHYHVATPALRSRTHVPAFALVVYQHDPDGTLIVLLGSRAPPRGGAEADFMEPERHIYTLELPDYMARTPNSKIGSRC